MAKLTKLSGERLEGVLAKRLSLRDPVFHLERVGGRWVGDVISPSFKGKRDHQRQKMIWDALEADLGAESVLKVGMILAYTPDEWNLGVDGEPAGKGKKAG